ncbi:hypothetical protein HPP92_010687 [Vanilla planifolia]|uniref:Uncharacterized protein n=1 Tax=Vanilla planifolia TaxID=51239 RepID=A0A835UXT0_VANPL|nr:hypothetical protein HPP92_010687 [Vanilla planifolia]
MASCYPVTLPVKKNSNYCTVMNRCITVERDEMLDRATIAITIKRTEKKIIKGIKDHVQILLLINVEVLLGNVLKKHMDIERVV